MSHWFARLDAILRAHAPEHTDLDAENQLEHTHSRVRILGPLALVLGAIYGIFMGTYALRVHGLEGLSQLGSSTIKLPLLFLLTLIVTFPSLYVFGTLLGSRLTFTQTLGAVTRWIVVMLAVAASLGPVLGFFTISTMSYPFIVLLNVALLGTAGVFGCTALLRTLHRTQPIVRPPMGEPMPTSKDAGSNLLTVWILIFGIVGLQMAWVMRPFIGAPEAPFAIFRPTNGHVFHAIGSSFFRLIGV